MLCFVNVIIPIFLVTTWLLKYAYHLLPQTCSTNSHGNTWFQRVFNEATANLEKVNTAFVKLLPKRLTTKNYVKKLR